MVDELIEDGKRRMDGAIEALRTEFNTVRTGRASTALLDRVFVDYYGVRTPLKQMANVATPDPRLISITVFDKSAVNAVVRAIQESDLGLTPNTDGTVIRLNIPSLTTERRKELVKLVHKMTEEARVAVRNVRRDVISDLKDLKKDGDISEDDEKRAEDGVQKLTDKHIERISEILRHKEEEILEV
ncbi:MAG: ribosome recycling factor [Thermoleophilia bacterium]|jgi:ribosome recycling factor|nr:ribosome recycling factor [Thermoleophilia bacterium]